MLTLNTQNNYPKSGRDQCKGSQEIAGPVSEIPDGKPIPAALRDLFGSIYFRSQMETQVNKTKLSSSNMQNWFDLNSVILS